MILDNLKVHTSNIKVTIWVDTLKILTEEDNPTMEWDKHLKVKVKILGKNLDLEVKEEEENLNQYLQRVVALKHHLIDTVIERRKPVVAENTIREVVVAAEVLLHLHIHLARLNTLKEIQKMIVKNLKTQSKKKWVISLKMRSKKKLNHK